MIAEITANLEDHARQIVAARLAEAVPSERELI
jgi:hypothetical protein